MLKLSVVKVFPCVLMFSVTTQLEGFRKKVMRRLNYTLELRSRIKVLYQVSLSSYCTFHALEPDNILTLLRKMRSVGTLYNIWT